MSEPAVRTTLRGRARDGCEIEFGSAWHQAVSEISGYEVRYRPPRDGAL